MERMYRNSIAILIVTVILVIMAHLAGCGTTHYKSDNVEWKSFTLFKDIQAVEVESGDVKAKLGSSAGSLNQKLVACVIAPELDGCK